MGLLIHRYLGLFFLGTEEVVRQLPRAYQQPEVKEGTDFVFVDAPRDPAFAVREAIQNPGIGNVQFIHHMINAHYQVKQSGLFNFQGCKIPVFSKFNTDFLERQLRGYEYSDLQVVQLIQFGFPLGYQGPEPSSVRVPNHKGAKHFPKAIQKYLDSQIQDGKILGPFKNNPLVSQLKFSPLNSVEKKDSSERRVIGDLSFPPGDGVNFFIDKDEYLGQPVELIYPTIDDLVRLIRIKGKGCLLFKVDLLKAYRQIPVDPGDINLLAYSWNHRIYLDCSLVMGCRSSAFICQRITNALMYIYFKMGFLALNFLDDMLGVEVASRAWLAFRMMKTVLRRSGAEEAEHKECLPATSQEWLGILVDTIQFSLSISQAKVNVLLAVLDTWLTKVNASKREVQSIVGKLVWVAAVVRPGRLMVSRLLNFLRGMEDNRVYRVTEECRADVRWWKKFLPVFNGIAMFPPVRWEPPDTCFATDACLEACGGVCEEQYFHELFPKHVVQVAGHITALELLSVMVALKIWAVRLSGKKVKIYCDNMSAVYIINSNKTRDRFLQDCMREILFMAAVHGFEIRAEHIGTAQNRLPDLLSRWHLGARYRQEFNRLKSDNMYRVRLDDNLFDFQNDW